MSRRVRTLIIGGILFVALFAAVLTLPVPYVVLSPGPTFNTLGKDADGVEVIALHGKTSQPTSGHLNMTTVDVTTAKSISIVEAFSGWFKKDEIVVPRSAVYPPGQSQKQVDAQNATDFNDSRSSAVAAAMCQLGYPKGFGIVDVSPDSPSKNVLQPGDELVRLDGKPVGTAKQLADVLETLTPHTTVDLEIVRDGRSMTVPITLMKPLSGRQGASIGISVADGCLGDFSVDISLADVGGPSAGMMFALGIVDEAGSQDLTGGAFIAGTGTITPQGQVGPIGGIELKMIAARRAGATIFLAPASNCADVRGHTPAGLKVIKVSTLSQAVDDLLKVQEGASVPTC